MKRFSKKKIAVFLFLLVILGLSGWVYKFLYIPPKCGAFTNIGINSPPSFLSRYFDLRPQLCIWDGFDLSNFKKVFSYPEKVKHAILSIAESQKMTVQDVILNGYFPEVSNSPSDLIDPKKVSPLSPQLVSQFSESDAFFYSISYSVDRFGTDKPELIAFLPNVTKYVCSYVSRETDRPIWHSHPVISNVAYPEQDKVSALKVKYKRKGIVYPYGCLQDINNNFIYYHVIVAF